MIHYVWPVLLVVASNVVYQICAKGVPKNMDVMASMTITYLVGAACSAIMFFIMNKNGNLIHEYSKLNAAPIFLGISVVGLEVGFIYAYKAGWAVSTLSIVQSAFLALALIFVGALLYKEAITVNKVIGVLICLVGLYFINKK
ncbi:TPA: EamA family transporter [Enterococcus faecium]|jgi:drug/metabolite transporter (DMT)-like permease|nr:EamA family transporter [Enterococcus faecium]